MVCPLGSVRSRRLARALALAVVLSSCGGGSGGGGGSSSPPSVISDPPAGTTRVTGSERIGWRQANAGGLRFLIYVDDVSARLDGAVCNGAPDAECSSPLPSMSDGVHTLAVAAVSASGEEGPRSDAISVQKVSARSGVSTASLPDATRVAGGFGLEMVVTTADGQPFAIDVVDRALSGAVQLAAAPDGRLLVAAADGRVHVVRPGAASQADAFDTRARLEPPPSGALGVALHPDFARNHFVYLSFVSRDQADGARLRVVRLREVGDTLGEAATIFEAPLVVDAETVGTDTGAAAPRLAFGPDGLLYALLPGALEFDGHPAASRPHASMVRIDDEGGTPSAGPLSGIAVRPLGFSWHPLTGALWGIVPAGEGYAIAESLSAAAAASATAGDGPLRLSHATDPASGTLRLSEPAAAAVSRAFADAMRAQTAATVRLTVPVVVDGLVAGMSARVTDLVASGSTWYTAVEEIPSTGESRAVATGVILRFTPRTP
jgi:Glucose / Sorbosone dehydrogenase